MEINTQQMEALLQLQEQQAQLPRKNSGAATGFEEILGQQLSQGNSAQMADATLAGPARANFYNPLLIDETDQAKQLDPDSAVLKAAFDQASGTLDLWDSYAHALGTSTNDTALRDAWNLLEGIDNNLTQMKSVRGKNPELDALLNELEIMATTEKFKFNRGDYTI